MTGIIFIFVAILAFWLFTRNAKKNIPNEEDSYDAREEGNKAIKAYRNQWSGIGFNDATDEQYELISNMENIYKPPENPDFNSYQDSKISDEQIIKFVKWAKIKKSKSKKSTLIDVISDELDIYTPEISINFEMEFQDDGGFFGEDIKEYGFCITRHNYSCYVDLTIKEWVKILSEPMLFDWFNYSDWDDPNIWDELSIDGYDTYYLKENNAEFIPPSKSVYEWWDYQSRDSMVNELIKVQPVNDFSYKGEIFEINDEEFTFLKNEREHLIILLMASYNDNLLDSIISNANN